MPESLLIRDGLVIDPEAGVESKLDVLFKSGRVAAVAPRLARRHPAVPALDAKGCWVLPGLVDMHAHLREPGGEAAETIASGTLAAAAGGFTTVLAMPNTKPPVDSPSLLRRLRRKADREARVNVLFAACASRGQKGEALADLAGLAKLVCAVTEDGKSLLDSELMRQALARLRRLGRPFICHCEDPGISLGAPVNLGAASRRLGLPGQSWLAETLIVARDISLARQTRGRVHIAHVSCRQSVAILRRAKAEGLPVTAEAAPHHLCLCEDDIPGPDPDFKMNPPLRSRADRAALRRALADGTIDVVATDHAPHAPASKRRGMAEAPFGVIGLETALAAVLTHLVHKGRLGRRDLVRRMSAAPARILGLKRKGTLAPGSDADAVVVDPRRAWVVPRRFHSKSRNSPFCGMRLRGRALATVVSGKVAHAL